MVKITKHSFRFGTEYHNLKIVFRPANRNEHFRIEVTYGTGYTTIINF